MAEITANLVNELRKKTGAGMMDCKKALTETAGDFDKAVDQLRKKGLADAAKKSSRVAAEGMVQSYIHAGGKVGVLVEVNCETDFVAKNPEFQEFCKDIALHICANTPLVVSPEDVDPAIVAKEREIYIAKAKESGKPDNIIEKIVEGQVKKFTEGSALLTQPFVKNPDVTVATYLAEKVVKIGEKLVIRRFVRYQLGEGIEKAAAGDYAEEVMAQIQAAKKD